jgi:riboflavin synthase
VFTGIVEEVGTLLFREHQSDAARLLIRARKVLEDVALGDSISVNGVCLTVTDVRRDEGQSTWSTDVMGETLRRSSLGKAQAGDPVNLERAVSAHTRLGGHIVQGHVDAVGEVVDPVPDLRVRMPDDLRRYVIEKGSITVDGVSLTVVEPTDDGFTVAVIPHTAEVTTLGAKQPGDTVNLEVDLIAKYVERLVAFKEEP